MSDHDYRQEAVDELYGGDTDTFLTRRTALASAARKAGDRQAAKEIAAFRKPTRSATLINHLARREPERIQPLLDLGDELRAAERSVDAGQLRQLNRNRRELLDDLASRALSGDGESAPPAALRDEVVETFSAALADPEIAHRVSEGTLVRAERWEGFGFGAFPGLALVPDAVVPGDVVPDEVVPDDAAPSDSPPEEGGTARAGAGRAKSRGKQRTPAAETRTRPRDDAPSSTTTPKRPSRTTGRRADAKPEGAEAAEARRAEIAAARTELTDADEQVTTARSQEQELHDLIGMLDEQIADARRRLDEARLDIRRAEARQRKARHALDRAQR